MSPPNTPGFVGYVAAVAVAFAWNSVLLAAPAVEEGLAGFLGVALIVLVYQCVLGPFVAVPGVLLVHLVCRRVRWQWVHVAAAAAAGAAGGLLLQLWLGPWPYLVLSMAVSCGLGRLALVPQVHRLRAIGLPEPAPVTLSRRALPMRAGER